LASHRRRAAEKTGAVILSKAMLLARDDRIEDSTIVSQIATRG
jgi:hypothetical protein